MRAAMRAEWTKLRTVPGPGWLLLGVVASMVALGAVVANSVTCTTVGCAADAAKSSLTGVQLGQAVVAVLAVLVVGDEYGTGMIRTTLMAMPRRSVVLAAKALILVAAVLVAAGLAVAVSLIAGSRMLALSLSDPATLRAAAGTTLYLALVALLGLGIAAAVRDSAAAVGVTLGLLYLFPILASTVGNPAWHRHLQQISPSNAGLAVQATVGLDTLPIGPWAGLGVLALWATAALLIGGLLLQLRDA
jgi:ABC-2 type transport system permease protein